MKHFGLDWLGDHNSSALRTIRHDLRDAIESRELVTLIAPTGWGKTHILNTVKRQMSWPAENWVYVRAITSNELKLEHVLTAIVRDRTKHQSSPEPVRNDIENRTRQADRLLCDVFKPREGAHAVVVIEDAHRMKGDSLAGLKLLREIQFNGVAPVFSVVMLGWPALRSELSRNRRDIDWRSETISLDAPDLGYMDLAQRTAYLRDVFKGAISDDARPLLANRGTCPQHLNALVKEHMKRARDLGHTVVDERVVTPTLKEMKKATGVSYADLADVTGLGKTTVHRAIEADATGTDDKHIPLVSRKLSDLTRRVKERSESTKASTAKADASANTAASPVEA